MGQHQRQVFIKTFGCQMNVYDSGRMVDALAPMGYAQTDDPVDADVLILNTCHIREKAAEKVYSELGRVQHIKADRQRRGRKTLVVVAGCVAQAEGKEILARAPIVDVVVGPQSYHRLPELLFRAAQELRGIIDVDFPVEDKFAELPPVGRQRQQSTAFVTVQEGCDKFCTFCVVPYTRGAEASRPVAQVMKEAERLVDAGVVELTLLGQNVNAYHGVGPDGGDWSLAKLLRHLSGLEGLERLRYTTSHPIDMTPDLIAAHGELSKLMPYLHLPFQAGSDRVLAAMNRRHRIADYFKTVAELRSARPDIALSTDIIVGFPGETEEDFAETLSVVRKVHFAQAYSFKYSPRPGTPGENMADQIPDDVKADRLSRLQAVLAEHQLEFNSAMVGRSLPVLFDRHGKKHGQILGRSPYLQAVHAQGAESAFGQITPVRILDAGPNSLTGVIESVFDEADSLAAMTVAPAHSAGGHL